MDVLKTIAIDISKSVFENDSEGIMYITKDIYSDIYIVAIPVITFSWDFSEERLEMDYQYLKRSNVFGDRDKKERLVTAIREGIEHFRG